MSQETPHRYTAALAAQIETSWQERWQRDGTFVTPNPGQAGFDELKPKFYCLDMFPYPSGAGLHVGHPEGYTATDIICRYKRMKGFNVLHPMGWDAFGLPAEQYAIATGIHPSITTRKAIETFRAQLQRFGFSYDWSREFATIDPDYYTWTQWIFLKLYDAWYDTGTPTLRVGSGGSMGRARPIAELIAELERGVYGISPSGDLVAIGGGAPMAIAGEPVGVRLWHELTQEERRELIDSKRLAYVAEQTVNWCPKLGTALANEEVKADGRSERGDYPVFKKKLRQWMFRITAYAERLLEDLKGLDWPESTRTMQTEWIGRSEGAEIEFALGGPFLRNGPSGTAPASSTLNARETIRSLEAHRNNKLCPRDFVAKDPYPPGIYGPVADLVEHRRSLPHLQLPGATYFVTWRTIDGLKLTEQAMTIALRALTHFDGVRCQVYAANVMNTHIHWIVRPLEGHDLPSLIASVKRFSARQVNEACSLQGNVWEAEQFDHIIRDAGYFSEFLWYVIDNPVKARLVKHAAEYPYTFVHPEVLACTSGGPGAPSAPSSENWATQGLLVFTTRPDTIFGATYMVIAPEHPLVDDILADPPPGVDAAGIRAYVAAARNKPEVDRMAEGKDKTGVFSGLTAINPATDKPIPIWIADYVLMGYGTGAIMAVPGQDERDWEFAEKFGLPIVRTVRPPEGFKGQAYTGDGPAINSGFLDGLGIAQAKARIIEWLQEKDIGRRRINYKLRDWLFSRQRYWGEPFPIVFDRAGHHHPVSPSALPVLLPEMKEYKPVESDDPQAMLAAATSWINTTAAAAGVDPRILPPDTPVRREANTMPNWAGSCWYYLRFCDPKNAARFVGRQAERYWMGATGVDLYVGGSEHAVLHLLYARFWHKVLFDLGEVSTPEPMQKLFHQGLITSYAYQRPDKSLVPTDQVQEVSEGTFVEKATGQPVAQVIAKMSKSLKNVVNPDDVIAEFGADTMRLYEMYMGPLEASKPWNPRDITGLFRFLQRAWRAIIDENTGSVRLAEQPDEKVERELHRTIARIGPQIERLSFNTAIADLIKFVNIVPPITALGDRCSGGLTKSQADRFALILAPFAPHVAEELWSRLGNDWTLAYEPWPEYDEKMLQDASIEIPVQILGKLRGRITVPAGSDPKAIEAAALAEPRIKELIEGKKIAKVIVIPGKLVNIVAN